MNPQAVLQTALGERKQMSIYSKLVEKNWVSVFIDDINAKECQYQQDGTYKAVKIFGVESPWLFTNIVGSETAGEGCYRVHKYLFPKLKIIPILCHSCFKVVVKPRTVVQLLELYKLQKKLNLPSKCGIERRSFVTSLYSGYFYNKGIEAGLECYDLIRKRVSERIDPSVEVILKRGCTEFEMYHGPSDKWAIPITQKKLEDEFNKRYVEDNLPPPTQTEDAITNIKLSWILFAAQKHDMSYKELTDGHSLVPECNYVTYHQDKKPKLKLIKSPDIGADAKGVV